MKRILLLTGKPGTGKTALIREAVNKAGIKAGGFYTREIRTGGADEIKAHSEARLLSVTRPAHDRLLNEINR